jgi:membrane protease YdiL (CAAX protease family)
MLWVMLVFVCVAAAVAAAARPALAGSAGMWLGLGVPYACLSVLAVRRLGRSGSLRDLIRFKPGDPSLGALLGAVLLAGAWLVKRTLLADGSPEQAWLWWIFAQIGDPSRPAIALGLVAIVVCEELVWRGWVQTELREALGARRGWILAALCYSLAHAATLFTLRDERAGLNPLLVLAALGGGLVWGFVTERTRRLLPAVFAHAVFSYFGADYFRPM